MAPSTQPLDVGDSINLVALILGVFLSLLSITIAIATCRRTKSTPQPHFQQWHDGHEELMIAFAISHRTSSRNMSPRPASPSISQNASSVMRLRRIEPSSETIIAR